MVEKDKLVEEVLAYVNSARILAGMEPLTDLKKGYKKYGSMCPIAKSLVHNSNISIYATAGCCLFSTSDEDLAHCCVKAWNVTELHKSAPYFIAEVPRCFTQFIAGFDHDQYPQYEEKGEKN